MIVIGHGRDIHRLSKDGKPLILGGVLIPSEKKVIAHSDGDVLLHALSDALFGALALGDIGTFFPSEDEANKDLDSKIILSKALEEVKKRDLTIDHVDIDIILEKPRLREYIPLIKKSLCTLLNRFEPQVSIKAQTNEGLDAIGRGEAIECQVVVILAKYYFY